MKPSLVLLPRTKIKAENWEKSFKNFENLYLNPEVPILNLLAQDYPRQKGKVEGRRDSWRAGRTKTITKPVLQKSRIHYSSAAVLHTDLKFIIDLAFRTAGTGTKTSMIINACFCGTCFNFKKGTPPPPPQRSCILKGHQLLKKSHIFQNVFLQFKVTVRDDREGFLGLFVGGCHGAY